MKKVIDVLNSTFDLNELIKIYDLDYFNSKDCEYKLLYDGAVSGLPVSIVSDKYVQDIEYLNSIDRYNLYVISKKD